MIFPFCKRFAALEEARQLEKLGPSDIARKMHAANAGHITLQTMIFEPKTLRLYLSAGKLPASAGPFRMVDLKSLLTATEPAGKKAKK